MAVIHYPWLFKGSAGVSWTMGEFRSWRRGLETREYEKAGAEEFWKWGAEIAASRILGCKLKTDCFCAMSSVRAC